jgi:hypothetical protein
MTIILHLPCSCATGAPSFLSVTQDYRLSRSLPTMLDYLQRPMRNAHPQSKFIITIYDECNATTAWKRVTACLRFQTRTPNLFRYCGQLGGAFHTSRQHGSRHRSSLLSEMKDDCINAIDNAIGPGDKEEDKSVKTGGEDEQSAEESPEEGDEMPGKKPDTAELLQRLLYKGILPRYAFPTDVATFHVFDGRDRVASGR